MSARKGESNMITVNGVEIKFTTFPNGETNVDGESIILAYNSSRGITVDKVVLKYENDSDLIKLMFVQKHLNINFCELVITYMPYSRQDRIEGESVFTLKHVCDESRKN